MSDEALRDRIADVLDRAYNEHDRNHWGAAQAIIDELGLRVEGQMGAYGEDPIWEERVAGKWEAERCPR